MTSRWSTTAKRAVVLVAVALTLLLVVRAQEVITPFVWAGVFAYVFGPLVGAAQRRTGARRGLVVTGLFIVVGLFLYGVGRVLLPIMVGQLIELRRGLPAVINNVEAQVLVAVEGTGFESVAVGVFDQAGDVANVVANNLIPLAMGVLSSFVRVLVFVIALFYFLRDGPRLGGALRQFLPSGQREELLRVLGRINSVLGQYVRGQVILIAIMGTATTLGLSVLQVPFSALLGSITGVVETVPIVGPISAGALAVLVAFGHPAPFGWTQVGYAAVVAIMYTILRHVEDYFVIPQVIGRIVELHPLLVIFALFTGGAIAGLLGLLLAVPVAASSRIAFLYAVAKLRDEDPYRVIAEAVAVGEEPVGVKRPA